MRNIFVFAAVATVVLGGCKKDATSASDNQGTGNLMYEFSTSDRSADVGGRTSSTFIWTGGYASVSEIRFDAKGDNKLEYRSRTPITINLFDSVSSIGGLTIPSGTYRKAKVKVEFEPTSTASALELRGTYTSNNNVAVPLIFRIDKDFEVKYEIREPFTITDTTQYSITNTLPLNGLLNNINDAMISNATRDNNGVIVVSSASNTNLYNLIIKAFDDALRVKIKKHK